jgi:hypothetical protein
MRFRNNQLPNNPEARFIFSNDRLTAWAVLGADRPSLKRLDKGPIDIFSRPGHYHSRDRMEVRVKSEFGRSKLFLRDNP